MLVLPKSWENLWGGKDPFHQIFSLQGKVYKEKDNRKTLSFEVEGKRYFAKLHRGVGWGKIITYLLSFRLPVLSAENEWRAILRLQGLNINTTPLVGYGKKGWNPGSIHSFVITEALRETKSLEHFCGNWPQSPPDPALKRALIREVARIAGTLHQNSIIHRDLYICHFLLRTPPAEETLDPKNLFVYLIDLHRVRQRRHLSRRWQVKDIAGLYFSSMDTGLTQRDLFRFMRAYTGKTLKETLQQDQQFWQQVKKRGLSLHRKFSLKKI